MNIETVCNETGFSECEFPPEKDMPCEKCNTDFLQLYFRGPTDSGCYYCAYCVIAEHEANLAALAQSEGE